MALAEIQKQPGCSNVRKIAIIRVTNGRAENNWSTCVVSAGAADADTAAGSLKSKIQFNGVGALRTYMTLTAAPFRYS
jgi:hypothetical protein